jgi:hypothetical protein
VLTRAVLVAALAVMLLVFGIRSGLSPPQPGARRALSVRGADPLLPQTGARDPADRTGGGVDLPPPTSTAAAGAARDRRADGGGRQPPRRHPGGASLLAGLLAAESLQWLWTRVARSPSLGALALAVAAVARCSTLRLAPVWVPIEIARLVGLPIPNPEWISPSFRDVPPLYVAIAAGVALLALAERRVAR